MASNKRKSNSIRLDPPLSYIPSLDIAFALSSLARNGPYARGALEKGEWLVHNGFATRNYERTHIYATRKGLKALDDLMYALWPETAKMMEERACGAFKAMP